MEEHVHSRVSEYERPDQCYLQEVQNGNPIKLTSDFVVPKGAVCRQYDVESIKDSANPDNSHYHDYKIDQEFTIPYQNTPTHIKLVATLTTLSYDSQHNTFGYEKWFVSKGLARKRYLTEAQLNSTPTENLTWNFESCSTAPKLAIKFGGRH